MSLGWLTPDWPAPQGVRALSTWRTGGVSTRAYASLNLGCHVGDSPAAVAENRRQLALAAHLPAEPHWLRQVHGTGVADLDAPLSAQLAGADAAFTRRRACVCAILTADCVPVLFAARNGSAVAASHAGWRGLAAGVLAATTAAVAIDAGALLAWIGPCIGPEAYEVGPDVHGQMLGACPSAAAAFRINIRGRYQADLALIARLQLQRLGISRIYGGGVCTYTDANHYFSHRRDGQTGRQATLIWLE
ncbi:MAG: peptidoglycan editing factor PgeF [Steroidobacterales bacterium]